MYPAIANLVQGILRRYHVEEIKMYITEKSQKDEKGARYVNLTYGTHLSVISNKNTWLAGKKLHLCVANRIRAMPENEISRRGAFV